MKRRQRTQVRVGISMLEILAVVALMGIIAMIVLPRLAGKDTPAKINSCHVNKGNIEVQAQLWFRNKGVWPLASLGDIGADSTYFSEGLPSCPVDGSDYVFDAATQRVSGHQH